MLYDVVFRKALADFDAFETLNNKANVSSVGLRRYVSRNFPTFPGEWSLEMSEELRIGFIGCGQMATALASGFIRAQATQHENVFGYDVSPSAATKFAEKTGATICNNPTDVVSKVDTLIFAVKPQYMAGALDSIKELFAEAPDKVLCVSIAAGLKISFFEDALGSKIRLVRVMPNTPCLVGEGASGFSPNPNATETDVALVKSLLETIGVAYCLPESQLDAVTGLSGSGPAYVFMAIEALADGGVKVGLPRKVALDLAAQTLKGSAEMYLKTQKHPGTLKDAVTSPGGTTIAGVAALEEHSFRAALIDAVERATVRSRELGEK